MIGLISSAAVAAMKAIARTPSLWQLAVLALTAALPSGCVTTVAPHNPFAGVWSTAEHQEIAFRDNTVVVNQRDTPPTPMSAASCDGTFRFDYAQLNRAALLGLAPKQPDLRRTLAALLVRAAYPVAELACGEGGSTYVLLDDRDLVAIHRDRDIAGVERLSRL